MGWTQADLDALYKRRQQAQPPRPATIAPPAKGGSKHRNTKTLYKGVWYDSAKEAARAQTLELWELVGAIRDLRRQVSFDLYAANGERIAAYRCDFHYWSIEHNCLIIEDVKSEWTRRLPIYRLKFKLMRAQGNPITEV